MHLAKSPIKRVQCERCGQDLTDPESIRRGMGPECSMSAGAQFAAVASLVTAMSTGGWMDPIASRFLIEKRIVETVLNRARIRMDYDRIKKHSKRLEQINGILVRREQLRLQRLTTAQEVL